MIYDVSPHVGWYYGYAVDVKEENIKLPVCPVCGRSYGERWAYPSDEDLKVTAIMTKSRLGDFSRYDLQILVSDRAREIMEKENISGYRLGPIKMVGRDEVPIDIMKSLCNRGYDVKSFAAEPINYYRLFVDGRVKMHEKSGLVMDAQCKTCGYEHYIDKGGKLDITIVIDSNTWDGNDLFRTDEFPLRVFCSERFKKVCKKHKLKGLDFEEYLLCEPPLK